MRDLLEKMLASGSMSEGEMLHFMEQAVEEIERLKPAEDIVMDLIADSGSRYTDNSIYPRMLEFDAVKRASEANSLEYPYYVKKADVMTADYIGFAVGNDFNKEIVEPGQNDTFPDGTVGIRVDDDFWTVGALPLEQFRDVSIQDIVDRFWPKHTNASYGPDVKAYTPRKPGIDQSKGIYVELLTMELSGNRKEYYTRIICDGRTYDVRRYGEDFLNRAQYEVDQLRHILLGEPEPSLLDEKYDDIPQEDRRKAPLVHLPEFTAAQVDDVCLSFQHDFGLLPKEQADQLRFAFKEWMHALSKLEGPAS